MARDSWVDTWDKHNWSTYYFDYNGHMVHDVVEKDITTIEGDSENNYYFDHNGHYAKNTRHKDGYGNWSYSKVDGTQAKEEWLVVDGQWYYFDDNGTMARDGWVNTLLHNGSKAKYYFDKNGHYLKNAWHDDYNGRTYFKSDGKKAHNEWVSIPGDKNPYYFDYTGYMAHSGWLFTTPTNGADANYYFDDNGQYEEDSWHEEEGSYRSYLKASGKRANEEWVIIGGQWYYFDYNGFMVHDCYLDIPLPDSDSNVPATIPAYYFDHNGHPIKLGNLPDISKEDGYMVEELSDPWRHKGNHLIYKKSDLTQAVDEWINAGDGNRYYFDNNGYCTKREKINAIIYKV